MDTQPLHRAVCARELGQGLGAHSMWGNSCGVYVPVEDITRSSPVWNVAVAVLRVMLQELSTT